MAEKPVKTPKIVTDVPVQATAAVDAMREFAVQPELPEAARDMIAKTMQTLKDKGAEAQAAATTAAASAEKIAAAFAASQAATTRSLISAAFDNYNALIAHAEQVVAVKSPVDALQLNVAFAQSFAQQSYDRVVAAAEAFKTQITDNTKLVQDEVAKLAPALKIAA